jgi:long-chain acyl-CoA synthetase
MAVLAELDQIGKLLSAAGQPFELTTAIVNGISLPVYRNLPPNLTHLIVRATSYSDRIFIVRGDRRLTYADALGQAAGLAEILRTEYGAVPGVRVAIAMRNSPEWILSFFAILLTGATAVLVNSRGASDEVVHALRDTECAILIADPRRAEAAADGFQGKILVAADTGDFRGPRGQILNIPATPLRTSDASPDDPAIIMFTSGTTDRWDPAAALALIVRERISQLTGPPSIFWDLLACPAFGRVDLSSLMNIGIGGQATPPHLLEALVRAIPNAAPSGGWGMTETNGSIASFSGEELLLRPHAAGRILPIAEVRIVDEHDDELPLGGIGEICVKSVLVMSGYWNQPEANQAVFSNGWLRTGDIGFVDADRYITIVDRKKDMIISGGENIYCAELERVFNQYPGVLESAAFGVPDERLGERAVVAVVPRSGNQLAADDLNTFARTRLADYKMPSEIVFTPTPFVRNVVGKIDRVTLRKDYGARASGYLHPQSGS